MSASTDETPVLDLLATARVASATGAIVDALAIAIEVAEADEAQ